MDARRCKRVAVAAAAAVVVLTAAGAGSCVPDRSDQPDADQAPVVTPTPQRTQVRGSFERHNELDVPDGMRPVSMEFVDGYTGYTMLRVCDNRCRGSLFVTFDGGYSWIERRLPVERVDRLHLDVVDARTIVVTTEPDGWFRSGDSGRSFTRGGDGEPKPTDLRRGVSVGCPAGGDCAPAVLVDGRPPAAQPALPADLRYAAGAPGGRMWAVGAAGTTVHTATSTDGGATWSPLGGPLPVPGTDVVQLAVSADGTDVWLFTSTTSTAAVFGLAGGAWRPVVSGLPLTAPKATATAAGDGVLAVTGQRFGYVFSDGRWSDAGRPGSASFARQLSDGTLFTVTSPGDIWLGAGSGAARLWSRVAVDPI